MPKRTKSPKAQSPASSTEGTSTRKSERSHEENQERAFIAASRRSDRSIEARMQSARQASNLHKQRTGRGLKITEEIVLHEDMYEEEDDDLPRLRNNASRGYSGSIDIPPGTSLLEHNAKVLREQELDEQFNQIFGNVLQQSRAARMGQQQFPAHPPQQLPQQLPQQQPMHNGQSPVDTYAAQFQQQQQQQQMHQMQQRQQQYLNQQQQPPYPLSQPAGQFYPGQAQPFPGPEQQPNAMNDPAYFQHRNSIPVTMSDDGSFVMVSPQAVHSGIPGHMSRTSSVADGSDMVPDLSNSSSNETGSNGMAVPMAISGGQGNFGMPPTTQGSLPLSSYGQLSMQTISPQPPGLQFSGTPNTTPSVSTPASQDAIAVTNSPMPAIRRGSSGVVPNTYGAEHMAATVASPVKPIDTAAWAATAGTDSMTVPVMDPNMPQISQGHNGINMAMVTSATWPMDPQNSTITGTIGPAGGEAFSTDMAIDNDKTVAATNFIVSPQQHHTDTTMGPAMAFSDSQAPALNGPPSHLTAEAMREQLSSRIGTPGGGAGDSWNEWVQFGS